MISDKDGTRKWINKHPITAGVLLCVSVVLSLQILYWVLCFFNISLFSNPFDESNILNYCGNIMSGLIGGIFAVFVLKKTLENEREVFKKERQIQVMSFLDYKIVSQKIVDTKECIDLFDERMSKNLKCMEVEIEVSNLGLGNALYLEGDNWVIIKKDDLDKELLVQEIITQYIAINQTFHVKYCISLPSYDDYDEEIGQKEIFYKKVIFKDILGNTYKDKIEFTFERLKYWIDDEIKEDETVCISFVDRSSKAIFDK